jgi:protein SCO1/2
MGVAVFAFVSLMLASPLAAKLDPATIDEARVAPPADARVPITLAMTGDGGERRPLAEALGGRPALLIFADYTCRSLCGSILALAAVGLDQTHLVPGRDFRVVVIGLDPKDSVEDARAMKRNQIGEGALAAATTFLVPNSDELKQLADAVGYRFVYDTETDQFAHPAAVFVVTPDGRVAGTLSALGLDPMDLRLALVGASEGRIGSFVDHLQLLCYGYDPVAGIYTLTIRKWLALASLLTVIALAGGISLLLINRRPGDSSYPARSAPSRRA